MKPLSPFPKDRLRRLAWPTVVTTLTILALLLWRLWTPPPQAPSHQVSSVEGSPPPPSTSHWQQGSTDARFILILYADLECPYCKDYYPVLVDWVARQRDIRLQWHHLIVPSHEPAASYLASLAECAGNSGGHATYWKMITWLYQHTRGNGEGLPADAIPPGLNPAMQACIDSEWSGRVIRTQVGQARQDGVLATPSLRVVDQQTNRSMLLTGPIQGDVLLSALDLLSAPPASDEAPELSAGVAGDKPR
ncbi:DsbA family protein [Klebsiella pneumoniae]|uniref:DsbA family protein n=1 Tax=Klebsiella pneumoniae TaxID=573 RepID=UPI001ABBF77D|nr:thioredoxin domain-containing protein [Klebsiella pneumoniae]MBO3721238.1 DsbA family protein [Klebsiella pneumoniae]HCM5830640.1 DsbA family protein [Klebsiella pneumoniae]